uniref:Uncharacterized protein n=1 Tax=Anguilla anguilla TaxID=7936 RepID=A0A0E9TZR4_ANGAN
MLATYSLPKRCVTYEKIIHMQYLSLTSRRVEQCILKSHVL